MLGNVLQSGLNLVLVLGPEGGGGVCVCKLGMTAYTAVDEVFNLKDCLQWHGYCCWCDWGSL